MYPTQISFGIAFIAGLASFLSPCVLPLVPIYLAQLVGPSVAQATEQHKSLATRLITLRHATMFVLGFTFAFIALGATASTLGSFLHDHLTILRQVGGVIIVIFGLHLTGILHIPLLYQQKRFTFVPEKSSYPASLLMGLIFGIAWSPCLTPILAGILVLAANATTLQQGVWLLLIYSLGLGVPFLLLGLGVNQVSRALKWCRPHLGKIEIGTGILMIVVGAMIFFNVLTYLNSLFSLNVAL
ncbi:cytochrome c biogenesis CcdA family protein [Dictyobacter arantiisoli]|uniref:Cytochrome C biogenesis protein CcdA n=1 Tax=Dictyobacter arantiisoli TaxID=2014874 RepID=A0A5A5T8U5_9CHLR|nr:cytochrome c biogenesis protein CcdA [Dictyobacter arantiisoli]GCF07685.1 cytochrome C biogenesis protein CcdA [Dictyobacter arantiisoli]